MLLERRGTQYHVVLDEEMTWAIVDAAIISGQTDLAYRVLLATVRPSHESAEATLQEIVSNWQAQVARATQQPVIDES